MKSFKLYSLLFIAAVSILTSSCSKKEILNFGGTMEKLTVSDSDGSKTYLGHAEKWIYWEQNDDIKVYVGSQKAKCTLVSGSGTLNAFFRSEDAVPEDQPIYAIYPYSSGGDDQNTLIYPAEQPYREAATPTNPDSSFGRGAMPMVAFKRANVDTAIYFHNVSGILRIQLYSKDVKTLTEIQFKETSGKQISGPFTVHDITKNAPYLTGTAVSDANRTIKITNINREIGPAQNQFLTFYLPLPAVTSASNVETYTIEMTVKASDNTMVKKNLRADIHRRNITMMPALNCKSWTASGDGSQASINLVGSGTKDRPFQIYTAAELDSVRIAFDRAASQGGHVYINNQDIKGTDEEPTYFKVVRSDIKLVSEDGWESLSPAEKQKAVIWNAGISNFKGYMYFASSTATNGGITNESNHPLFESISETGKVERLFVKGDNTPTVAAPFSPMCNTNRGVMLDCHNKCRVTQTENYALAGLCIYNYGAIIGGANEARLQTQGNVAGICYQNNGTVQGNFSLSAAVPKGAYVGGICYLNNALIRDCLVSASTIVDENGNWGIICYQNNANGIVDNCVSTGTIVYTIHGSVGGICNINRGTVRNCSNMVEIRASSGNVGGIVALMDNANAKVYNCKSEGQHSIFGAIETSVATNCGGIVGRLEHGRVSNCYNQCRVDGATNTGGIVGYLVDNADAIIENCWTGYGQQFCGLNERYDADINSEQPIGMYCFSVAITDQKTCNRIVNTAVDALHAFDVAHMLTSQASSYMNDCVGQFLGLVLNAWVNDQNAGRSDAEKYYVWTTETAYVYPRFEADIVHPDYKSKALKTKARNSRVRRSK